MKTEMVVFKMTVVLKYETEEGRKKLIERLKQDGPSDMVGCGGSGGSYSMKPMRTTARVE